MKYLLLLVLLMPVPCFAKHVYVDIPSADCVLDSVDRYSVYLQCPPDMQNDPAILKLDVEVEGTPKYLTLFYNGDEWKKHRVATFDLRTMDHITDLVKAAEKKTTLPTNTQQAVADRQAEVVYQRYQDPAYQEHLRLERVRVQKDVIQPIMADAGMFTTTIEEPEVVESLLAPNERIYVFVSSSMPLITLRNYAADIASRTRGEVVMVMRGMVGGFLLKGMKDTQKFVQKVIQYDPGCDGNKDTCPTLATGIQIDPELFVRYSVDRVPTTVFATGVSVKKGHETRTEGSTDGVDVDDYYLIAGDYSLLSNLEQIQQEAHSEGLGRMISALQ